MSETHSVLFVCLGNICRSAIAEAVFRHKVVEKSVNDKWVIDSAGLGDWHVGGRPDKRSLKCLRSHGITSEHTVRQVTKGDFTKFSFIFGMDNENISELNAMKPKNATAVIKLLGEYDPQKELIIEDPYYGDYEGFEKAYTQCERCCEQFLMENMK